MKLGACLTKHFSENIGKKRNRISDYLLSRIGFFSKLHLYCCVIYSSTSTPEVETVLFRVLWGNNFMINSLMVWRFLDWRKMTSRNSVSHDTNTDILLISNKMYKNPLLNTFHCNLQFLIHEINNIKFWN